MTTTAPIDPASPLTFSCGLTMKNRFMLAPMTNCQSHSDGGLSDEECRWLTMRAEGGFGLTMTCASHVQEVGRGFPGQLGIFSDALIDGHRRLAAAIREHDSLAVVQLHHAGMRSPRKLIGTDPVCPSDEEKTGARAMTTDEVRRLRDDFIEAAVRAQKAGYDGVEVHGAHGYILGQFLSSRYNHRRDEYGDTLENRARIIFEILEGIRATCGAGFLLSLRLSPERFGMVLNEIKLLCRQLIKSNLLDILDISLWDVFKQPHEEEHRSSTLLEHFTGLDRGNVRLTVAGKIATGAHVHSVLRSNVDFVTIGRAAVLHHDYPKRVLGNADFEPNPLPVSRDYLKREGLSDVFIEYMGNWPGFVGEA